MELEKYYNKNLKKLYLSKFLCQNLIKQVSLSYISFWLLFKNIKKNTILGFIIVILIGDGKLPFLLKKKSRKQTYFLGLKVILSKNFIYFLQKFLLLYFTGLEQIVYLNVKQKGMHNLIILKKEFPYAPELDLFLDSIMRSLTTTIFKIIVTLHGGRVENIQRVKTPVLLKCTSSKRSQTVVPWFRLPCWGIFFAQSVGGVEIGYEWCFAWWRRLNTIRAKQLSGE